MRGAREAATSRCEQVFGCPEAAQTDAFDLVERRAHRTRDMSRRAEAWARERYRGSEAYLDS